MGRIEVDLEGNFDHFLIDKHVSVMVLLGLHFVVPFIVPVLRGSLHFDHAAKTVRLHVIFEVELLHCLIVELVPTLLISIRYLLTIPINIYVGDVVAGLRATHVNQHSD